MITGVVNAELEAIVHISVKSSSGREALIAAVVDTGLNGALTLPLSRINVLELPWRSQATVILANGSEGDRRPR